VEADELMPRTPRPGADPEAEKRLVERVSAMLAEGNVKTAEAIPIDVLIEACLVCIIDGRRPTVRLQAIEKLRALWADAQRFNASADVRVRRAETAQAEAEARVAELEAQLAAANGGAPVEAPAPGMDPLASLDRRRQTGTKPSVVNGWEC
jgi:predicted TIM-barrel fold metal-dependent hydrolase